jgi:hypothetical protein
MQRMIKIAALIVLLGLIHACEDGYEIEYQDGYPNALADNWIAFEFQGGDFTGNVLEPYNLVTALDPNRSGYLIVDKIYNSDVRFRATISDTAFSVEMGEQLELINTNNYDIEYITARGYVTSNPVLTDLAYDLAVLFYENMAFEASDIEDVMLLRAGFYDSYKAIVDTVLILGYRKTGFENIDY